jgi:heme exporter protein B
VLFVSLSFAGVLGMGRSWARERELGALRGLLMSPIPRASIYLGKLVSTTLFLGLIALLLLPIVGVFFHLEPDLTLLVVAGITLLTCFGFAAAGTLFAALTVQTRARDLMLSVVVFPLVTPTLLAGVLGAREVLGGAPISRGARLDAAARRVRPAVPVGGRAAVRHAAVGLRGVSPPRAPTTRAPTRWPARSPRPTG